MKGEILVMAYDVMVFSAHPDDAEVQMGGTIVKLVRKGLRVLLVDLCEGEPADFAEPGVRHQQAMRAAEILQVDRIILGLQDRLIQDTVETRLQLTRLICEHRPRWVFGTAEACIHPDHAIMEPLLTAAVFFARLKNWDRVPGAEVLADVEPWEIERLFFPHCKMEPAWGKFDFAVDVSDTYEIKQQALAQYRSIFEEQGDRLLALYEAEDLHMGRLIGGQYAEVFKSRAPLVVEDPTVFSPAPHG
ncbi:MAG: PIG-L family deacetylase [Anaerolineales bacterium]|jgi:LmbE family N-acetylglucosaminyl deacetylase